MIMGNHGKGKRLEEWWDGGLMVNGWKIDSKILFSLALVWQIGSTESKRMTTVNNN